MANTNSELIYISPGQEPPGRYIDGKWQGPRDWAIKHGVATCYFSMGNAHHADAVLLPDGTRQTCYDFNLWSCRGWRHQNAKGGFTWGDIEFTTDDAIFKNLPQELLQRQVFTTTSAPNLELDLHGNSQILDRVKDGAWAGALFLLLEKHEFYNKNSDVTWSCKSREAGAIVSELRANGECYLDFLAGRWPIAFDAATAADVEASLLELGWTVATLEQCSMSGCIIKAHQK